MNKERVIVVFIIFILAILLGFIVFLYFKDDNSSPNSNFSLFNNSSSEEDEDFDITTESTNISVEYSDDELVESYNNYDAKIDLSKLTVDGDGVKIDNNIIKISKKGVFYFSGENDNSQIEVDCGDDDLVVLVFDGVKISNKSSSVINGINAKEIIINLKSGTESVFSDAKEYSVFTDDDEPNSLIFSKTDLTINGTGSLTINANYKDGIASKDILKILNSKLIIKAQDDGIRGKDAVYLKNANITIVSLGDGIKSTNDKDGKGYIYIDGGTLDITSSGDGIDCQTVLRINDAKIEIVTNGEVEDKTQMQEKDFMQKGERTKFNQSNDFAEITTSSKEEENVSSKGIKAGTEITIDSGKINIVSTDDAIHSNGAIIINDINCSLSTGDDGITADTSLIIKNGDITISKSYEGLEAQYIQIDSGNINIKSSDDGINVYGGSDNMFMGMENQAKNVETNRLLVINGGNIKVDASGDGLDSNGSIKIAGGEIIVAGPTNSGNGALDYNYNFELNGGNIIYYGASGMWQDATEDKSSVYTVSFGVQAGNSNDKIVLKDEDGNVIEELVADKSYQRISFASEKIVKGKKYTLYVNNNEAGSIEITDLVSTNAQNNNDRMKMR